MFSGSKGLNDSALIATNAPNLTTEMRGSHLPQNWAAVAGQHCHGVIGNLSIRVVPGCPRTNSALRNKAVTVQWSVTARLTPSALYERVFLYRVEPQYTMETRDRPQVYLKIHEPLGVHKRFFSKTRVCRPTPPIAAREGHVGCLMVGGTQGSLGGWGYIGVR